MDRMSAAQYRRLMGLEPAQAAPQPPIPPVAKAAGKRAKRQLREHRLQCRVAEYLTKALPPDGPTAWTSIDHANARSEIEGANRKRRGVKAGLQDVWIIHQPEGRGARGRLLRLVLIELKDEDGKASDEQQKWGALTESLGALTYECRSVEEVQRALEDAGVPLAMRVTL